MSEAFSMPSEQQQPAHVPIEEAEALLRDRYGLSGEITPVATEDSLYFLIDNGHMRYLLDVMPLVGAGTAIGADHALMRHITRNPDGPQVPEPVSAKNGEDILTVQLAGTDRQIRLLTFLEGKPAPEQSEIPEPAIAAFGAISASLAKSLQDFEPPGEPGVHRAPQIDLRNAGPIAMNLLSTVTDQDARDPIARAMVLALRHIHRLGPGLRVALSHQNLTSQSVIGQMIDGVWSPSGITDLGDIADGWLVAGLASTCADLLASHGDADPFVVQPAVRAYHEIFPLNEAEIEALWPLIVARIAISAAEAENMRALSPDDAEWQAEARRRQNVLATTSSTSAFLAHAAMLDATGTVQPHPVMGRLLPEIEAEKVRLVDLGVASPLFQGGNWSKPDIDWKLLANAAWETGMGATRYGEYRLSCSSLAHARTPDTYALHVDVCLPAGARAVAPFSGTLTSAGSRLVLVGGEVTLHVEGLDSPLSEGDALEAGDPLGVVAGAENAVGGLRLQLCRDGEMLPPLFCSPDRTGAWARLCPSPATLLGLDADAPIPRTDTEILRGWREYLFDAAGRISLDLSGSAPLVGHGHPQIASAAYRQLLLSVPGSSSLSRPERDLQARLEHMAPDGLEAVFLFPGRAQAVAFAFRLTRAHPGRLSIISSGDGQTTHSQPVDSAAVLISGLDALPDAGNLADRVTAAHDGGSLVILDGTSIGFGRLGSHLWGFEHGSATPDVLIVGSADGSEVAAVMTSRQLAERLAGEDQTQPLKPFAAAMSLAALDILEDEGLLANARQTGHYLSEQLDALAQRFASINAIRGSGVLFELEIPGRAGELADGLAPDVLTIAMDADRLQLRAPLCMERASVDFLTARLATLLGER